MSVTKLSQSDLLYRFSIPFFTALRHRNSRIRTSPGNVVLIRLYTRSKAHGKSDRISSLQFFISCNPHNTIKGFLYYFPSISNEKGRQTPAKKYMSSSSKPRKPRYFMGHDKDPSRFFHSSSCIQKQSHSNLYSLLSGTVRHTENTL